jgi:hypothetical protein
LKAGTPLYEDDTGKIIDMPGDHIDDMNVTGAMFEMLQKTVRFDLHSWDYSSIPGIIHPFLGLFSQSLAIFLAYSEINPPILSFRYLSNVEASEIQERRIRCRRKRRVRPSGRRDPESEGRE